MLRKSCEKWLIMTENILPNCSSWNSVKKIDNEARKGNIAYVFQELITMLRCCIHHKDLSLSLQDHESNIKISIRKYRFMSSWEEIKAWPKESRARMTFYNSTCKMPIFCWQWYNLWICDNLFPTILFLILIKFGDKLIQNRILIEVQLEPKENKQTNKNI